MYIRLYADRFMAEYIDVQHPEGPIKSYDVPGDQSKLPALIKRISAENGIAEEAAGKMVEATYNRAAKDQQERRDRIRNPWKYRKESNEEERSG